MSLHKEIKDAYDQVHAPNALVERLKQELYQKDFHEEEVTFEVTEAQRPHFGKYFAYIAATLVLCAGCSLAVWSLRDQMVELHPGTNVSSTYSDPDTTEETTEPEEKEQQNERNR